MANRNSWQQDVCYGCNLAYFAICTSLIIFRILCNSSTRPVLWSVCEPIVPCVVGFLYFMCAHYVVWRIISTTSVNEVATVDMFQLLTKSSLVGFHAFILYKAQPTHHGFDDDKTIQYAILVTACYHLVLNLILITCDIMALVSMKNKWKQTGVVITPTDLPSSTVTYGTKLPTVYEPRRKQFNQQIVSENVIGSDDDEDGEYANVE